MTPEQIRSEIERGRHLVPARLWGGFERYFVDRLAPGGFILSVLSNDLFAAICRADDDNATHLRPLCQFLYDFAPGGSHGSREAVNAWLGQEAVLP